LDPKQLYDLQVYRLVTSHLVSGGSGLLWHLYMLYVYSIDLERGYFAGKRADYFVTIAVLMGTLDAIGLYMEYPILASAFVMGLTFLYSNIRAHHIVSFFFGIQFKAMYLPYVLLFWVRLYFYAEYLHVGRF
jgi:hypothetical protein